MTNSMIRRVAEAICRRDDPRAEPSMCWPQYVESARAVLKAMLEPTEAMLEASDLVEVEAAAATQRRDGIIEMELGHDGTVAIYQAMINAALSEETGA
jgi:hypothetical protein